GSLQVVESLPLCPAFGKRTPTLAAPASLAEVGFAGIADEGSGARVEGPVAIGAVGIPRLGPGLRPRYDHGAARLRLLDDHRAGRRLGLLDHYPRRRRRPCDDDGVGRIDI